MQNQNPLQNKVEPLQYWLMKTEPHVFSLKDLQAMPQQTTPWEGVRNYQARNFMKQMQLGDLAFFYHSSCEVPAIMGVTKVTRLFYPDETSWDKLSPYYDEKAKKPTAGREADTDAVRWIKVDMQFVEEFSRPVTLKTLKADPSLTQMKLVQKGQRLSIQPVTPQEFQHILKLAHAAMS